MTATRLKPVKGYNAFSKAFESGKKFYSSEAIASITYSEGDTGGDLVDIDSETVFYGVAISRRNAKKAVVRNRIKRLLRTALAKMVPEFGNGGKNPFGVVIIVWRIAPGHPGLINLAKVQPAVADLLERAYAFYKDKKKEER